VELIDFRYALPSGGYELVTTEERVSVYRRRGSSVIDLAAEGAFPGSPDTVRRVLLDYGQHARFVKGVVESRVLARGKQDQLVYQRLSLPLISDRDYTLQVKWGASGRDLWMTFGCANDRGPAPRPGVIRLSTHEGGWLLRPEWGARSRARYQVRIDLGGSLPRWLARSGAGREIPTLFKNIERQLR
jgi:hypothetical protein